MDDEEIRVCGQIAELDPDILWVRMGVPARKPKFIGSVTVIRLDVGRRHQNIGRGVDFQRVSSSASAGWMRMPGCGMGLRAVSCA